MIKRILIITLFVFGTASMVNAFESLTFKGTGTTKSGKQLILTGRLTKPEGNGPFPAVILLHGAGGIDYTKKRNRDWAKRLVNWGYVALLVDSFGPRGEKDIIGEPQRISPHTRTNDAYDAKSYLVSLPFVDRNRIVLMGWSHGGWTVLYALFNPPHGDPFRAAIAFYPYCATPLDDLNAPLLILCGEADDMYPASWCSTMMPEGETSHEVILKIYSGAYHSFDAEGMNKTVIGFTLKYNPEAAEDAIMQVKNYLARHFK